MKKMVQIFLVVSLVVGFCSEAFASRCPIKCPKGQWKQYWIGKKPVGKARGTANCKCVNKRTFERLLVRIYGMSIRMLATYSRILADRARKFCKAQGRTFQCVRWRIYHRSKPVVNCSCGPAFAKVSTFASSNRAYVYAQGIKAAKLHQCDDSKLGRYVCYVQNVSSNFVKIRCQCWRVRGYTPQKLQQTLRCRSQIYMVERNNTVFVRCESHTVTPFPMRFWSQVCRHLKMVHKCKWVRRGSGRELVCDCKVPRRPTTRPVRSPTSRRRPTQKRSRR